MPPVELFSPAEIGAVAGVPVKSVYKVIEQRLPGGLVVRRHRQRLLTRWGAVCVVIDHEMPKDVPVSVRKQLYAQIRRPMTPRVIKCKHGIVQYIVDVRTLASKVDVDLAKYRKAMKLIVEEPNVQAGAATFRGTRILVQQIADLISEGATETELRKDYPRLTRAMIAAAQVYAKAHPRRGRPRMPAWRNEEPLSERKIERRGVVCPSGRQIR
jgi:uncharacterized protein (DUF433 family)